MSVHFDSNCLPSPPVTPSSELETALVYACLLSEEKEPPKPEWLARNPAHLILSTKETNSTGLHLGRIQALAPNNPTVLITSLSGDPLLCSTIWIVSSARTVELYPSGEYTGTFRGETLDEDSTILGSTLAGPPLFAIKIDQEGLPRNCNELFVKFFVPRKPANFQDSLDLHWLIVQAKVVHRSSRYSVPGCSDNQRVVDATVDLMKVGSDSRNPASAMPSFATSLLSSNILTGSAPTLDMTALVSAFSSSVDMEKVRGMLSDMQIEGLSRKARDHMGAMETQAKLNQERASSSFLTAAPKAVAPETTFVTKAELAQTEDRILSHIDSSMSNLENRIMARIEEGLLKMEERLQSNFMTDKGTE